MYTNIERYRSTIVPVKVLEGNIQETIPRLTKTHLFEGQM